MGYQRRSFVAGNWKMNGSLAANAELLSALKDAEVGEVDVAVCVPFPYLAQAQASLTGSSVAWGAQNLADQPSGAFTGEVSASMLCEFGCRYVVIGHSERRSYYGETDDIVLKKTRLALDAGLVPIVCIGETLAQKEANETQAVIAAQLAPLLQSLNAADWAKLVLAYEPVWAIGTGKVATAEYAQEVHAFIRQSVALRFPDAAKGLRIQYGGSVKAENAAQFMSLPDVDGALVGGASLKASEFLAICRSFGQQVK